MFLVHNYCILYEVSKIVKLIETDSRTVVTSAMLRANKGVSPHKYKAAGGEPE